LLESLFHKDLVLGIRALVLRIESNHRFLRFSPSGRSFTTLLLGDRLKRGERVLKRL